MYKGTALTANILFSSILVCSPALSTDNVLLSTYFHFLFIGLLELPTSFLADLSDPSKATKAGFSLKALTTGLFAFFVFFVFSGKKNLALFFLIAEALVDGISNSLLSGAYQAAFIRKFKQAGIETKQIFTGSLRYSVPVRLIFPVLAIGVLALSDLTRPLHLLGAVGLVIVLRALVILRFHFEFRRLQSFPRRHADFASYWPALKRSAASTGSPILLGAFYALCSGLVGSYLLPSLQNLFAEDLLKNLLLKGSLLSLAFYTKVIFLGWAASCLPRLKQIYSGHAAILALITLSFILLGFSSKLPLRYAAVFAIFFNSFYGLRKAHEEIASSVEDSTEAGVISLSESLAMLAFCLLTPAGFFLPRKSFFEVLSYAFSLCGVILTVWQLRRPRS